MFLTIIKPFLPWLAAILLIGAVYAIGHVKGNAGCEIKKGNAITQESNVDAKIKFKVMSTPHSALDNKLMPWVLN